jgi:O-antigen/teichoic acid export membrane protein
MDNLFVLSGTIAIIYLIIRIAERKFIVKETTKPVKELVSDSIVVCVSSILGLFILDQFSTTSRKTHTTAFIGTPDF